MFHNTAELERIVKSRELSSRPVPSPTGYVYRVSHRHDMGFRGEFWDGFRWEPITGPEHTRKSAEYGCIAHAGRNGITADRQGEGYGIDSSVPHALAYPRGLDRAEL